MNLKKVFVFTLSIFIIVLGFCMGRYLLTYQSKCMLIHANKDMFYGGLALDLQKQMEKKGFNFNCPSIFPKIVVDFIYTGKKFKQTEYKKSKRDISIALIGDCFMAYDIEFLKSYDYLLSLIEYRFGYVAMFNFMAVHFPIYKDYPKTMCNATYDSATTNIEEISLRLEDIIERAINDKI